MDGVERIVYINRLEQAKYDKKLAERKAKEVRANRTTQTVDIGQAKGIEVLK